MALNAYEYISGIGLTTLYNHFEALSSCAIENNRLAEVCAETLRRILHNELVSDRYVMGLCLYFMQGENK
jgi:hypothetical protein